ncbi:MAG: hypothetical protein NC489_27580 [Ruminococcus flavefaciens]|nr:hypothetical protein [Ruminococcus flavefaciens]
MLESISLFLHIFLYTMFADPTQRIKDVKTRVTEKGHLFEVISTGSKTALVKIDNVYYELIPDAVRIYYATVHGVRLRRREYFKQ